MYQFGNYNLQFKFMRQFVTCFITRAVINIRSDPGDVLADIGEKAIGYCAYRISLPGQNSDQHAVGK
jgi:hypothetical protein